MPAPGESGPARGTVVLRGMIRINFWASSLWVRWEISSVLWAPPWPAGLCLAPLSSPPLLSSCDVFNKRFMQEQTWDPLPAQTWGSAN